MTMNTAPMTSVPALIFVPLPDVIYPQDNADGDDLYAELSMYYNAERFVDRMKALGD